MSIRKTEELKEKVMQMERLPYPIIIKHGNPPHYTILQLDRDLRDRGRLTTTDYYDLTNEGALEQKGNLAESLDKEQLEKISIELSDIQQKIWQLLDK